MKGSRLINILHLYGSAKKIILSKPRASSVSNKSCHWQSITIVSLLQFNKTFLEMAECKTTAIFFLSVIEALCFTMVFAERGKRMKKEKEYGESDETDMVSHASKPKLISEPSSSYYPD